MYTDKPHIWIVFVWKTVIWHFSWRSYGPLTVCRLGWAINAATQWRHDGTSAPCRRVASINRRVRNCTHGGFAVGGGRPFLSDVTNIDFGFESRPLGVITARHSWLIHSQPRIWSQVNTWKISWIEVSWYATQHATSRSLPSVTCDMCHGLLITAGTQSICCINTVLPRQMAGIKPWS